tara:strand:- start:204 stop:608 length:405 start_codon:yes stop_codon:yes gene_type:complete
MRKILQNTFAFIAGAFIGGTVNMILITHSGSIIPLPKEIDQSNMLSLAENIHLFKPINYTMPFLAHALGTLTGAYVAAKIALTHKLKFALAIGILFLIGGVLMSLSLPAPLWFDLTDLLLAYIPMALMAYRCAK